MHPLSVALAGQSMLGLVDKSVPPAQGALLGTTPYGVVHIVF